MILKLLILLVALLLPVSSWAAITFVANTDTVDIKNVASVTKSVIVSAGTDRILTYCSQVRNGTGTASSLSSVVFNGTESFTRARGPDTQTETDGTIKTEIWYLVNPTVTTANVVATYAGVNTQAIGGTITQFAGVSQTSPIDSHAGANGVGTAIAATITTIADNAAIIDCAMARSDTAGIAVGAGQTMRTDRIIGNSATPNVDDGAGVSTVVTKTPAGAEVMNWTQVSAFRWAMSAISLTPGGGTDPAPAVPGRVTLNWVNGTDNVGIANTTIRRCTGPSCNATIAPAIGTVAFPNTAYVDTTVLVGNTYGYSVFHTDRSGNVSTNHATVRVTTSSTPVSTPPTITSSISDATGATLVYGAVTPTKIKVTTYTSTRVISSVIHEMSDFPEGRFTETWRDGLQGNCFIPIDAAGLDNNADAAYQCDNLTTIVGPLDTTPPTLSGCQPPGALPAGTTLWTFSCNVNKPSTTARYDTTDIAYASMPRENIMALSSLTFSATVTGLTNGSTTTLYLRPQLLGLSEIEEDFADNYPALTSTVVTLTVAASTADVTPPGDVAGLAGTLLGNAVTLTWTAATDAVSYQVYQAEGACTDYAPAGNPTAVTSTQLSLGFGRDYCWKIKALDVVSNFSTNFSSVVTKTTPPEPDIERPSDLTGMTVSTFKNTVLLTWARGTDNSGLALGNIEFCQVETGQTDCANFSVLVAELSQIFVAPQNLTPGARYCYRGKNADSTGNVSLNYNTPICATTPFTGLPAPRAVVPFGVERGSASRSTAGTRDVRP